jgi:hypothetical protein
MIDEKAAPLRNNTSLIQKIIENHPNGEPEFRHRFGGGLRYLAGRDCPSSGDDCFEVTVRASLKAIRQGAVTRDEDVSLLVRRELLKAVAQFPQDAPLTRHTEMSELLSSPDSISWLEMFTPLQREVLTRFYLQGQDTAAICRDLPVDGEHVSFIRASAKTALQPHRARTSNAKNSASSADSSVISS